MRNVAETAVLDALRKHWVNKRPQARWILAVSGGVDSMVMLEGMARLCGNPSERAGVIVLHVNHCLRGPESDGDEVLVLSRARELGFQALSVRLEWAAGEKPSQDLSRKKREAVFHSLSQGSGDRILLAHHLNDQAETVLFRLIRGTGARGLRGMLPVAGKKIRPFLGLEKSILQEAAEFWGIRWREDSSNQNPLAYERNWIRTLFPVIESRRPGFPQKLAALAEEARHWPLDSENIPIFEAEPKVSFARPRSDSGSHTLSKVFGLSRGHSRELSALLEKPSGQLHAEGVRFSWSAGVLMIERGRSFMPTLSREQGSALCIAGSLGRWEILGMEGELLAPDERQGDSVKKEFQRLRVPTFFRRAIPLFRIQGRPVALLPSRLGAKAFAAKVSFQPSALGSWWLGL